MTGTRIVGAMASAALVIGASAAGPAGAATGSLTFKQVTVGRDFACAVTTAGGAYCWGFNGNGQLGDGTTTSRSTPVPVLGLGSGVASIQTGWAHTCAQLTDGTAQCWGANYFGQLGTNIGPEPVNPIPTTVVGLRDIAWLSTGFMHTCAATRAGAAWCWGSNRQGQLGDPDLPMINPGSTSVPVPVYGLSSGVKMIEAGYDYSCALVGRVASSVGAIITVNSGRAAMAASRGPRSRSRA